MTQFQVVCMGVITMDTVALVENYPAADERVLAQEIIRAGGGPAAVAAVALARLGIKTAIVGTIGDDADGHEILRIFKSENIDTTGISIGSDSTAGSVIIASQIGSTRSISTRQAGAQVPLNSAAKELISNAQWLHCDHVGINRVSEAGISRGTGPKISFDAGYGVEKFNAAIVDLFVPTDRQMQLRHPELSLAAAIELDSSGAKNIVVATMGPAGSSGYSEESGPVSAPGFNVQVLSTLGAGDVFHGALLAQMIQGRPLQESLLRANAVAALSCRGLDGQSAIPNTAELEQFIKGATQ